MSRHWSGSSPDSKQGPLVVVYGLGAASPMDLLRAAGSDIQLLVVVDSRDPHTARVSTLLGFFDNLVDLAEQPIPALAEQVARTRPAAVVTFSERMLEPTALLADALGLPFHTAGTIRRLTDKAEQRAVLSGSEILACKYAVLPANRDSWTESMSRVGYPAVAKPIRGEGGVGVRLLGGPADLAALRTAETSGNRILVEEYLGDAPHPANPAYGSYVSVEVLVSDSTVVPLTITDKLRPVGFAETGSVLPHRLPATAAAAVTTAASLAAELLGVTTGSLHVEVKLTPHGPRIIEVNGRLGGSVARLLRSSGGWDVVRCAMKMALTGAIEPIPTLHRPAAVIHVPAAQGGTLCHRRCGGSFAKCPAYRELTAGT